MMDNKWTGLTNWQQKVMIKAVSFRIYHREIVGRHISLAMASSNNSSYDCLKGAGPWQDRPLDVKVDSGLQQ